MKKFLLSFFGVMIFIPLFVLCTTIWAPVRADLGFNPLPNLPTDLDQYLAQEEAPLHPKADTEKKIIWAESNHQPTEISLVFLHGFSATRHEVAPLVETLGQQLHANIFLTRLQGHGLENEAMGKPEAKDWLADANEALAIGQRLGHQVILIGCSTGGSLAIYLAKEHPENIKSLILLSPNFRPNNQFSWLASGPMGGVMARLVIGKNLSWQPKNDRQAFFWTHEYPISAVHHMMDMIKYIDSLDLTTMTIPTLVLYTDQDHVVSPQWIERKFNELGSSPKKIVLMETANHILAGDIVTPEGTAKTLSEINIFLQQLR